MSKPRVTIHEVETVKAIKGRDDIQIAVIHNRPYVVRTGQFKDGDDAIVIRAGSQINCEHPFFDFLKNKKGVRRVRKVSFKRKLPELDKDGNPKLDKDGNPEMRTDSILSTGVALTKSDVKTVLSEDGIELPENASATIYAKTLGVKKHIYGPTKKMVVMYQGYIKDIERKISKLLND